MEHSGNIELPQIIVFFSLHYYSARKGLFPMAIGMIKQAAKTLFNLDIRMIVTEIGHERHLITEHVIFTIEAEDEYTPLSKCVSAREPAILKVIGFPNI
jgi:hypothetical protein